MMDFKNRTVWLTGASSGIGLALAERLIKEGANIIVTARSIEKLNQLQQSAPQQVTLLICDIGDKDAEQIMQEGLTRATNHLDTVILNAGTCEYVDVENFDSDLIARVNNINYMGFVKSVAACLPFLKNSKNQPNLVGISSAAAYIGLPRSQAYGGSKAAMRHFLQSMRLDLAPFGITTSIVYPGFVDTPLTRKNDFPMPFIMSTQEAVEKIMSGLKKQKLEIAFPRKLIWPLKLLSVLPAGIAAKLGSRMAKG